MAEAPGTIPLTMDERERLGNKFLDWITDARTDMRDLLDKTNAYYNLYESNLPPKSYPWEGCSNVNLPLIQSHVDTWHSSLNDVIFGVQPYVLVRPPAQNMTDPEYRDAAVRVENALQTVQTCRMKLQDAADQLHLNALMQPIGIAKLAYRVDTKRIKRYAETEDETGQTIRIGVDREEITYNGPKLEPVSIENFVIYPTNASIQDAILVGDRFRLTEPQLLQRVRLGLYDPDAVAEVIEAGGKRNDDNLDWPVQDANEREGIESSEVQYYEFWEFISGYDADGDGIAEDCCFVIDAVSGLIVSAREYPYWHGRRYYIGFVPFPRPNHRTFGRTLPGLLEHCQLELNAIHNQRIDAVTMAMTKMFKLMRTSQNDPNRLELSPGAVIMVDSADELQELQISPVVPGLDAELQIKEWSERASPINDTAAGKTLQGERHTATEVQLIAGKANLRISDVVRRLQESYIEVARQTLDLMYQFATDEDLEGLGVTREELAVQWDLLPNGTLQNADKGQKKLEAQLLYQALMANPIVQSNPKYIYRVTQNLLSAYGVEDIETFIGAPDMIDQQNQEGQLQMALEFAAGVADQLGVDPEDFNVAVERLLQSYQSEGEAGGNHREGTGQVATTTGPVARGPSGY